MSSTIQDVKIEDEDIVVAKSANAADAAFDLIIGTIEELIMEPEFQDMQDKFMSKNYKHFEDSDENKLIYTTIHQEYTNSIEKYLESQLKKRVSNFSMDEFMKELRNRKDELDGEIFEILLTFQDFIEFKQLMLSFKASKEGKSLDLSSGLCIQSIKIDNSANKKNTTTASNNPASTPRSSNAATSSRSANNNQSSSGSKAPTPLLDKTQVDHNDSDRD